MWKRLFSTQCPDGRTWGQAEPYKGKAELLGRAVSAGDITQPLGMAAAQGREKHHEELGQETAKSQYSAHFSLFWNTKCLIPLVSPPTVVMLTKPRAFCF